MGAKVCIRGDAVSITLAVAGYERPQNTDVDDANWLVGTVSISAPNLSGTAGLTLVTTELNTFCTQLRNAQEIVSGTARLETLEEGISLVVRYGSLGRAEVEGRITLDHGPRLSVSFSFETDQSYLAATLMELEQAVSDFPVVTV